MNRKRLVVIGLAGISCVVSAVMALAGTDDRENTSSGLAREVREATRDFRNVTVAMAAGYGSAGSCVSGPEEGAMGIHFRNLDLIGDPALEADRPELLVYELRGGRLRLVAAEFLVIAEAWHKNNMAPPVLMGQHFHYVGSPNRYGLPAFYELHVWAWRDNPHGMFVDWNPAVSCEEYEAAEVTPASAGGHGSGH
jgi:hypothetical protein